MTLRTVARDTENALTISLKRRAYFEQERSIPFAVVCQRPFLWPKWSGRADGDVWRGQDRRDTARLFRAGALDQGDREGVLGVSGDGSQGHPGAPDRVQIRTGRSTFAEAWRLGRGVDGDSGDGIQAGEAGAPFDATAVRGTARARIRRRPRQRASLCEVLARGTVASCHACLCADELRAGGGLPVRLEPRDDHAPGAAADSEGSAHEAVAQPHAVRSGLFSRDPGAGVRRP